MNITKLEAGSSSIKDIESTASAMPFLSSRRLVIINSLSSAYKKKNDQEKILALFDNLPASTALVLNETKTLSDKNWLLKWVAKAKGRAFVQSFPAMKGGALAARLRKHASDKGGEINPQAAAYLAELAGEDVLAAISEVEKMLDYVNYQRPIEVDDVENLSAFLEVQGDFFALIDSLGVGDGRKSISMLHKLLEDSDPLPLFFSLVSNYRLLIQTREIIDNGGNEAKVAELLSIHPYRAKKLTMHARKISLSSLDSIYHLLHDYDLKIKTGQMDSRLVLDMFVTQLSLPTT